MDTLSDILRRLRASGSLFSRAELQAPWAVQTRPLRSAIFHVIVRGAGWAEQVDASGQVVGQVAFQAGDVLLFPRGDGHILWGAEGAVPRDIASLPRTAAADGLPCVHIAGPGPQTALLCGTIRLEPELEGVLRPLLPGMVRARGSAGTAAWLDATMHMLSAEVGGDKPGGDVVLARLADILLVQVLRTLAATDAEEAGLSGWLRAATDPRLQRALGAIHARAEAPWTTAALARQAGMSRSAFCEAFSAQVGEPPAQYLTRWRMQLARAALRRDNQPIAAVAERVGYRSEAAFSRAFKRDAGVSPARWRERAGAGAGA